MKKEAVRSILLLILSICLMLLLAPLVFIWRIVFVIRNGKDSSKYMSKVTVAIDQLGSALLGWGEDETMSSHMGRMQESNTLKQPWTMLCKVLNYLEVDHCKKNIGV